MSTANVAELFNQLPPNAPQAEAALLGSMLIDGRVVPEVAKVLTSADDFYQPAHSAIYQALLDLHHNGSKIDLVTLSQRLTDQGVIEQVGGVSYLTELGANVPHHLHAGHYANIVAEKATRRRLVDACSNALHAAYHNPDDDVLAATEAAIAGITQQRAGRFAFYTAAEFDKLDLQRDYHIPGVLAAGPVPTVLAGSFKTLKTSVALDMLLSLATGAMFLNHYPVSRPVNVAVMSGESGGFALQSLARRVLHARGWTMGSVGERFRICPDVLSLAEPGDLSEVERFIVEHDIKAFAIDPTYLAMRGLRSDDAGSIFAMATMLEPLARLGERTGCTPIIVHHNSRGATRANANEPAELADIAWSGFAEWAGQWLLLSRREKYDPDSDGEHLLWLSAGGRDGHSAVVAVNVWEGRQDDPSGRRWQVEVEQATQARQAAAAAERERGEQQREARKRAALEADVEAVVKAMERTPEGETKTSIREWAGLSGGRFNPALATLLADDRVVEVEITKPNGQTYSGFKLHPDAPGRTRTDIDLSGCPGGTSTHPDSSPIGGESGVCVCAGESPTGEQGQLLDETCPGDGRGQDVYP
mgnify:CR=1 FL=1